MAKRNLNWAEIKARYLAGERPKAIAADYRDCSAMKISQKAHKENWRQEREKIRVNVASHVEEEAKALALRVIEEYKKIAFTDMRNYAMWGPAGVKLMDSKLLTSDEAACIAEVSESTTGGSIKFKLHNKIAALDALAKHLGLFDPPMEAEGQINPDGPTGPTFRLTIQRQENAPACDDEEDTE